MGKGAAGSGNEVALTRPEPKSENVGLKGEAGAEKSKSRPQGP